MLAEYRDFFPSTIVRFAALFSDWCEYPPLFVFLETWLSGAWNARVLGGRGQSAIPYLHVDDLTLFFLALLDRLDDVPPGQVLQASPDGAVSHQQLYDEATLLHFGNRRASLHVPRPLCGPGMWSLDLLGRLIGKRPFERPWMARYVDKAMTIDASRTRSILGWEPRPRLQVLRRLPFLLENRKTDPIEWNRAEPRGDEGGPPRDEPPDLRPAQEARARDRPGVHRGADRARGAGALPELPAGERAGPPVEPHAHPPAPHERGADPRAFDPRLVLPRPRGAAILSRASRHARSATPSASSTASSTRGSCATRTRSG